MKSFNASLVKSLSEKRCLIVCGGGGVGKTTIAASLAIAATQLKENPRKRVLVITIDPAKRLAEAFGFTLKELEASGEPLALKPEIQSQLNIPAQSTLHVGLLNPKYVLEQILKQVLSPQQADRLKKTLLYSQLSEMIYGLQEYTAYEWVTRMIQNNDYDLIVLDTPPAFHAKDFFNVPEKIVHLMESRVFQLFMPKPGSWFKAILNFGWVEKLLGEKIYQESRIFFETFAALRERILERCELLAQFFTQKEVTVVAVSTPESTAQLELEGLLDFLKKKQIPLESIIMNQVEQAPANLKERVSADLAARLGPVILEKLQQIHALQLQRSERAFTVIEKVKARYQEVQVISVPMNYTEHGFEILTQAAQSVSSSPR